MTNEKDIIICRCEDFTLDEICRAIQDGYTDFEELKRYLRIGMGPCQGRTCIPLVRRELANFLKIPQSEVNVPTKRPPATNVLLETIEHGREK